MMVSERKMDSLIGKLPPKKCIIFSFLQRCVESKSKAKNARKVYFVLVNSYSLDGRFFFTKLFPPFLLTLSSSDARL